MEANRRRYQNTNRGTSYVEGNTVRKMNIVPERRREEEQYEIPSRRRQEQTRHKTLSGINLTSLMVLSAAIIVTLYMCVEYLKLQNNVSQMNHTITSMEKQLITMTSANDAEYESVNSKCDLDHIYKVAVSELGMVYPNKNKVITYESGKEDYVRQYQDIPK